MPIYIFFFFSSRRRHTRYIGDWSSDVCSSDLRAACEMATKVNSDGEIGFRIGVGVNTGRVVAGSIGGAGRLNFSVIGDAVNVAARVEAATRDTGDGLLITSHTRDALARPAALISRGSIPLKGKT